jgi:hypothetical protein
VLGISRMYATDGVRNNHCPKSFFLSGTEHRSSRLAAVRLASHWWLMTQTVLSDLHSNHIIGRLSHAELERLLPELKETELPSAMCCYEPDDELSHAFFPINGIVSLLFVMEDGASAEISPSRAVVQSDVRAFSISSERTKTEFAHSSELRVLFLRTCRH